MQRVMIVGQPGAGKSTLARRIGDITGLPVVHVDKIHWTPGWVEPESAEKSALCAAVHATPQWVFERGHSRTWPERVSRADTVIWLDFPLRVRLWRVVRRTLRHYGQSRPDLPEDCPERFDPEFFRWIWDTRRTGRDGMRQMFDAVPEGKTKIRLRTRRQVDRYADALRASVRPVDRHLNRRT